MALTPEEAAKKAQSLYDKVSGRAPEVAELKEFYEGVQPLAFASPQWQESHSQRYKGFSDNWCEVVANSSSERESVVGFRLPGSTSKRSKAEKLLWDSWLRNEQDSLSSQGFLEAAVARRSFCVVWGDSDGDPIITWRSADQAAVQYDAETGRKRVGAVVVWDDEDEGHERMTYYTPREVWKFKRARAFKSDSGLILPAGLRLHGGWVLLEEGGYGTNHLGQVPVVEFPNRPVLGRGPLSDIKGTVSMQHAINLLWAYLFNAADHASMPARVVMGQEPPKIPILDKEGQPTGQYQQVDPKHLTEGRMLWLTGQNTKVDQWDAANLEVFTSVIEKAVGHIAAQTRTPPHYLVANKGLSNLSGDALKAAETGLVQKVRQAMEFFDPRLREVFQLVALQLGQDKAAKAAPLGKIEWRDPENRSDAQTSDAMLKDRNAGYPFEFLLRKRGHSPAEIDEILEMRERELMDPQLLAAMRPFGGEHGDPASDGSAVREATADRGGNGRGADTLVGAVGD